MKILVELLNLWNLNKLVSGLMTFGDPRNDEIVLMFVWDLEHGDKVH